MPTRVSSLHCSANFRVQPCAATALALTPATKVRRHFCCACCACCAAWNGAGVQACCHPVNCHFPALVLQPQPAPTLTLAAATKVRIGPVLQPVHCTTTFMRAMFA